MNEENKIRINFKGGSLNGMSTLKNESYLYFNGEVYKLKVTNKTISHLIYKLLCKTYTIVGSELEQ